MCKGLITIQEESLSDIIEEIKPLIEKHYEEIAVNKEVKKLNPNWERYLELETQDLVKTYTVRTCSGLSGYSIYVLSFDPHYKDMLKAENDVIFISKELRDKKVGLELIKFSDRHLKREGVNLVSIRTKVHQPFNKLLEGLEYNNTDMVYEKVLFAEESEEDE